MNFRINTRPDERQYVYNLFKDKPFVTNVPAKSLYVPGKSLGDYLKDVAHHKFVLSPRGNGLDCFRTWEALLMGSYPVVKTSMLDPLFKDLPVVIVQNWEEVTPEFLEQKYREFSLQKYDMRKLYMPYWLDKIKAVKEAFLES